MHKVSKLCFNPLLEFSEQHNRWQKTTDFEKLINLQRVNSVDMSGILHSKIIAVDITNH